MTLSLPAQAIRSTLLPELRGEWDGRLCVQYLQGYGYHWRQMEWIGWYFEHRARALLIQRHGGTIGPKYGRVVFDYEWNGVWDFKAHPSDGSSAWAYLNDVEAVDRCIAERGHLGWVLATGPATYDDSGDFKRWHEQCKGKQSSYVSKRIARGAPSRRRKVSFCANDIVVVEFTSMAALDQAKRAGWLRSDMQFRQRNSGGAVRRAKYGINLSLLPSH